MVDRKPGVIVNSHWTVSVIMFSDLIRKYNVHFLVSKNGNVDVFVYKT